jgi:thymidylate synthase (FAD)
MDASLVWITPDADRLLARIARVSNPAGQDRHDTAARLIGYMARHGHWSPFEMVSACLEVNTTRDIGRQLLRHRSMHFQEFSQRYADTAELPDAPLRLARMQDAKNRQASAPCEDPGLAAWWMAAQEAVAYAAHDAYRCAIQNGIAKEVARAVLPEGLTPTRMYVAATLRDWWHFVRVRTEPGVQPEAVTVASACADILRREVPVTWAALEAARP